MDKKERDRLQRIAEEYRALYRNQLVSREEAAEHIMPYINAFNAKAAEIAKKFGRKSAGKITFAKFVR